MNGSLTFRQVAGEEPVAFLGGIATNYGTNYLEGHRDSMMVVEADEYDRSFLHLHPHSSIITSTDADHLDIYGDRNAMQESFTQFARQTHAEGVLLIKKGVEFPDDISQRSISYHTHDQADVMPVNLKLEGDRYKFSMQIKDTQIGNLELGLPGLHNLENALAASAICYLNGVSEASIREALKSFAGVKRRFEYIVRKPDFVFIDDYAHHPEELRACISSVRALKLAACSGVSARASHTLSYFFAGFLLISIPQGSAPAGASRCRHHASESSGSSSETRATHRQHRESSPCR
jgi:UDP-N-acetylmuramate--alanine ligase